MTRRSRVLVLAVAGLAAITLSALAGGANGSKHVTVAFVGADMLDPYYLTQHCGASAAAKANNATLTWQGVNGVDFAPEVSIVQRRRAEAPGRDRVVPFSDTAFVQPSRTRRSRDKVDHGRRRAARPAELATVHTDNLILGGLAADQIGEVPRRTRAARSRSSRSRPTVPVQVDRVNGFKNEVKKKYPGIDVVTVQYGGADAGSRRRSCRRS